MTDNAQFSVSVPSLAVINKRNRMSPHLHLRRPLPYVHGTTNREEWASQSLAVKSCGPDDLNCMPPASICLLQGNLAMVYTGCAWLRCAGTETENWVLSVIVPYSSLINDFTQIQKYGYTHTKTTATMRHPPIQKAVYKSRHNSTSTRDKKKLKN